MVTLSSIFQSVSSIALTALSPLSGGLVSAFTASAAALLASIGILAPAIPSALPSAGMSGLLAFGIPPIEILQPVFSAIGGIAEYIVIAFMPVFAVILTLLAVMAASIPVIVGMTVGIIVGMIVTTLLTLVIGVLTGWLGFLITPLLIHFIAIPAGLLVGYFTGMLIGVITWVVLDSLLLVGLGIVFSPIMAFANIMPIYFLNLLYLGVLLPFVALFYATLFTGIVITVAMAFYSLISIPLNIPLWGFSVIYLAMTALLFISLPFVALFLLGTIPLTAIATVITLALLDIPILLLAVGMTGSNILIPGPTSIGSMAGATGATAIDFVLGLLGSTGLAAMATVPAIVIGMGATALIAAPIGSLVSLGITVSTLPNIMAFVPSVTASTGFLSLISSLPGTALSMLAIPSQAINASIGTLTGSTGMLTNMTGNRAIHAAIGILQ